MHDNWNRCELEVRSKLYGVCYSKPPEFNSIQFEFIHALLIIRNQCHDIPLPSLFFLQIYGYLNFLLISQLAHHPFQVRYWITPGTNYNTQNAGWLVGWSVHD
ncbi:hypothetical protein AA313_de0210319 [Arthrobotrys entomopaga]|nr:hypothetical protein AA313_de0210319 [Arthrobotrys entomopaga]